MAKVTLKGNPIETIGDLPAVGSAAPAFKLVKQDLSEVTLEDYRGRTVILNVFPSVDTGTCAMSVRAFNERAGGLDKTVVLCVSMDLPFALARFCGAENIKNVDAVSGFRSSFGKDYGLIFKNGPLTGLYSRCIIIIDGNGNVKYTEQVTETADEPNYDAALAAR